jgi:hypothetical protein
MRDNTIGTHRGSPELTAYDPIKETPGSADYNAVSGPNNTVQGAKRPISGPGTYTAASASAMQNPGKYAGTPQPSLPRRNYIPTVSLDQA